MNTETMVFFSSTGRSIDILNPETNRGYYSHDTLEDLEAKHGALELITSDEALARTQALHTTAPARTTKADFWEALECLPPCKWVHNQGAESFYVSEGLVANIHRFYVRIGDEYWTCARPNTTTHAELIALVQAAQVAA